MRLHEITEGRWHDDTPTVAVYHGTSSALVADIKQNGLQLPPANIEEYARRVLHQYVPEQKVSKRLWKFVYDRCVVPRLDRAYVNGPMAQAIYGFFPPHFDRAAGYARSYAEHGGEIAWSVWDSVKVVTRKNINPRYAHSEPVVVTVEVPKEWIVIHEDMKGLRDRLQNVWNTERGQRDYFDKFKSFGEFADDPQIEVRIIQPVPVGMIVRIEPASGGPSNPA